MPYIGGTEVAHWTPRVKGVEMVNRGRVGPAIWTMTTYVTVTRLPTGAAAKDPLLEPVARQALNHGYRTARVIQMIAALPRHLY
ncbi:hypothetical protein [Sulfobacillus harzensis]|uniref:Uncharacterized protein n=1 Tax=Sulfobacillus harzensis TaxID=2729629 RepID=A0A7Y0L4E7_9FIRM|nr:hypothetical protein [Sulfobacillus harzensis]NMP23112.1 hypothetical protein [Sulfobacillus harzensis]